MFLRMRQWEKQLIKKLIKQWMWAKGWASQAIQWRKRLAGSYGRIMIWLFVLILAGFGWFSRYTYDFNRQSYDKVENAEFIRWHFLAHSDASEDQVIKGQVRDAVMNEVMPWFEEAQTIEDCRTILVQGLPEIQSIANSTLQALGAPYSAQIYYGPAYFSASQLSRSSLAAKGQTVRGQATRGQTVNGQTAEGQPLLAAGQYDSIKLVLGAGTGHNWWCLLFPPLSIGSQVVFEVPPQEEKVTQSFRPASKKVRDQQTDSVSDHHNTDHHNSDHISSGCLNDDLQPAALLAGDLTEADLPAEDFSAGDSSETAKNKKDSKSSQITVKPAFKLLEILKGAE